MALLLLSIHWIFSGCQFAYSIYHVYYSMFWKKMVAVL